MALVFRDKRPPRLDEPSFSDEAWSVIQRCWVRDPSKRPSMKDVVESISQYASQTNVRNHEMLQKVSSPPVIPIIAVRIQTFFHGLFPTHLFQLPRRDDNILLSLLSLLNNKQVRNISKHLLVHSRASSQNLLLRLSQTRQLSILRSSYC